ncbi:MAG: HAD family hydrolase [Synergistaceae bacterium]|nr:HAD family hydrolase [Synergistaceae bacterium]
MANEENRSTGKISRPAVFLDRDGTIIELRDYLCNLDEISLLPRAAEGLRFLHDAGYLLIVVTNQSGVARGYFTEDFVKEANDRITELFAAQGAQLDAFYYCPHHPDYGDSVKCNCRKPKIGMITRAAADFDIDLSRSWLIGDNISDIKTAVNAGIPSVLVTTGYGQDVLRDYPKGLRKPEIIAEDVCDAAKQIISWRRG